MTKQIAVFTCEDCQISYRVLHDLDEPYYCDECGEMIYQPPKMKVKILYTPPTITAVETMRFK